MENDGPLPDTLLEAILIDHYRCLPSQLDAEDAARLMRDRNALAVFRAVGKPHKQLTAAEKALIDPLMELDWERSHE